MTSWLDFPTAHPHTSKSYLSGQLRRRAAVLDILRIRNENEKARFGLGFNDNFEDEFTVLIDSLAGELEGLFCGAKALEAVRHHVVEAG